MNNLKPSNGFHTLCAESEGVHTNAYPDPGSVLGKECTRKGLKVTDYLKVPKWQNLSGAPWTIGIGHTGKVNGAAIKPGLVITTQQAYDLLDEDAAEATKYVNKFVMVTLNQNQFDALVDFTFNVGAGNFQSSTLLKKLNIRDFTGAANEFTKWNKSGGVVLPGLVTRRKKERELFLK